MAQPVQGQPTGGEKGAQWMPAPPERPVGCPPGLEYLTQLDQILVHQQVELLEAILNWETKNRYVVKNSMGQQVFFAREESGLCWRLCCQQGRPFVMHITDNNNEEVIRIVRPFQCCAGCCWCADGGNCCSLTINIESPPGTIVGTVTQTRSSWKPEMNVMNSSGETVLKIRGPCCLCNMVCCRCDIQFAVMSADLTQEVGIISKQWAGAIKEMFTNADTFSITFPRDLDVKVKAVLVGALFLIDFMFYEQKN
ncbi:phospholipid scramblase 2-like [Amphiura filiformis]|uniref:phospholipid scramblase 2-like n=1 Tax=Amphiura filiformis TaxID=82378 RepID=UPI003B220B38